MKQTRTKTSFPLPNLDSSTRRVIIKIDPADIAYVTLIIETYGYVGVPRTIDRKNGIVEILASPDLIEDARAIINALKEEVPGLTVIAM